MKKLLDEEISVPATQPEISEVVGGSFGNGLRISRRGQPGGRTVRIAEATAT